MNISNIGHYEILEKLGEGGMGVVYKARDQHLDRFVAVKVLPQAFAADSERLSRFHREAHVLAQLSHPNIAAIYGLENSGGVHALVMELAEGDMLLDRLASGPLPLEDAIQIARQIAVAIETAHERGIVHRDLKPANIKISGEGHVKVLDFGLAKALEGEKSSVRPENSPTLTAAATVHGAVLGTVAYMSPEQARGLPVDRRSDIWAFGVILFEMLTGRQLFGGASISDSIAGVLKSDPEWSTLPEGTPAAVRTLIRRCLERDRNRRLQAIGEARIILEDVLEGKAEIAAPAAVALTPTNKSRSAMLGLAAVLLLGLGAALGFVLRKSPAPVAVPTRAFSLNVGQQMMGLEISPDGRYVAYVTGTEELWLWDLSRDEKRKLLGPIRGLSFPFWSASSDYVGFHSTDRIEKISIAGGTPTTICSVSWREYFGASWSADDSIILGAGPPYGLYGVAAQGGKPELVFELPKTADGKFQAALFPQVLPSDEGARYVLYSNARSLEDGEVTLYDSKTRNTHVLPQGFFPYYSPSGHIIYWTPDKTIWALPFSLKSLRATGAAVPVRREVDRASVAFDGTMVYTDVEKPLEQLVWKDRQGNVLGTIGQPQEVVQTPKLSPDGRKVAVWSRENGNDDIWIHDTVRTLKTRFTTNPATEDRPIWSPDGHTIAFSSMRNRNADVFQKSADGTGEERPLEVTPTSEYLMDWSSNGRYLIYDTIRDGRRDIEYIDLQGDKTKRLTFLAGPANEGDSELSPDSRYLAYSSDESGRGEVYVQRFPQGGGRVQISTGGGGQPRWRGDGRELYYVEGSTLMAVPIKPGGVITAGNPEKLFEQRRIVRRGAQQYDVSPDGRRFVVMDAVSVDQSRLIRVLQNWAADFRQR